MTMTVQALANTNDFSYKKDYLNVSTNYEVIETLIQQGETDPHGLCLSDDVYIFDSKMRRKRRKIIVTRCAIYIFSSPKRQIRRKCSLKDLIQVVVSSENFTLAAFIFNKGQDFLMDSCRRVDIVLYIAQMMKEEEIKLFKIKYLKNFDFDSKLNSKKGKKGLSESLMKNVKNSKGINSITKMGDSIIIDEEDMKEATKRSVTSLSLMVGEDRTSKLPILQETFRNAKISGHLKLRKVTKRFFGGHKKIFKEFFFILTNVGLLYFKKFGVS